MRFSHTTRKHKLFVLYNYIGVWLNSRSGNALTFSLVWHTGIKESKGGATYLTHHELTFIRTIAHSENSPFDKLHRTPDRKDKYDGYSDDMLFNNHK